MSSHIAKKLLVLCLDPAQKGQKGGLQCFGSRGIQTLTQSCTNKVVKIESVSRYMNFRELAFDRRRREAPMSPIRRNQTGSALWQSVLMVATELALRHVSQT